MLLCMSLENVIFSIMILRLYIILYCNIQYSILMLILFIPYHIDQPHQENYLNCIRHILQNELMVKFRQKKITNIRLQITNQTNIVYILLNYEHFRGTVGIRNYSNHDVILQSFVVNLSIFVKYSQSIMNCTFPWLISFVTGIKFESIVCPEVVYLQQLGKMFMLKNHI